MRKLQALAVIALLTSTLSGCATSSASIKPELAAYEGVKATCPAFKTGTASDQIKMNLYKGVWPEVTFPSPLNSKRVETKVQVEGNGPAFTGNQLIKFDYQIINGATGDLLQASSFDGTDDGMQLVDSTSKLLCRPLSGVKQGSIVNILAPWSVLSKTGLVNLGFKENDSLVLTIKLNRVYLPQANGDAQLPQNGFPQVVTAASGEPGLVLQDWSTPAFTQFAKSTLIKGRGAEVKKNQTVTLQYSGFLWDSSKSKFDSSWSNGQPAQMQLVDGQLIPGFIKAVVGEHVGSRVIAVIPPQDGYGNLAQQKIPAGSTLIFVIDILGTD
mgnify:CR=1 FL=1